MGQCNDLLNPSEPCRFPIQTTRRLGRERRAVFDSTHLFARFNVSLSALVSLAPKASKFINGSISDRIPKMPRRRLRLSTSSDDDVEDEEAQLQTPTVGHPPVNLPPANPNPNHSVPLEISDDEAFIDVSDELSPTSPPPARPASEQQPPLVAPRGSGGCPISEFLLGLGLTLKREWLDGCVRGLERSMPDFSSLDVDAKAKLVFEQFLVSDMNYSGGGGLPENVDALHLVDLPGPYVLQVG